MNRGNSRLTRSRRNLLSVVLLGVYASNVFLPPLGDVMVGALTAVAARFLERGDPNDQFSWTTTTWLGIGLLAFGLYQLFV